MATWLSNAELVFWQAKKKQRLEKSADDVLIPGLAMLAKITLYLNELTSTFSLEDRRS